jgi:hypothetical protein
MMYYSPLGERGRRHKHEVEEESEDGDIDSDCDVDLKYLRRERGAVESCMLRCIPTGKRKTRQEPLMESGREANSSSSQSRQLEWDNSLLRREAEKIKEEFRKEIRERNRVEKQLQEEKDDRRRERNQHAQEIRTQERKLTKLEHGPNMSPHRDRASERGTETDCIVLPIHLCGKADESSRSWPSRHRMC